MRRSAMAGSAGSPPASWTACRRSRIPAYGYGIRYEHGLFEQRIDDGWQQELPEDWLALRQSVGIRARRNRLHDRFRRHGRICRRRRRHGARGLVSGRARAAVPYDTPIAGWRGRHVNALRLWSARAADSDSTRRASIKATLSARSLPRARAEAISRVLYPNDATPGGPGAAAAAGIFLHLGLAAGLRPPPSRRIRRRSHRCPITPRSSSTTRIRPSRSPN